MALINPHINFNGNAEEAFTFYKSVFGGEFKKIIRFRDLASDNFPIIRFHTIDEGSGLIYSKGCSDNSDNIEYG